MELIFHNELGWIGCIWTPDDDLVVRLHPDEASYSELVAMERTIAKLRRYVDEEEVYANGTLEYTPDPAY